MQSDERLDITIPAVEAISLLERLKRAERAVDSSRSHLDRETMIKLFLNRPGLSSLQRILGQSSTPEDDIDFLDTEGTIDAIRTTGYELITIASLLSLLRRKTTSRQTETDPFADLFPSMSQAMQAGPMRFMMDTATQPPPGASRSDPLTSTEAENIYALVHAAQESIDQGRKLAGMITLDVGSIEAILRDRSIFLLRMRGHHFREIFPLGHNCCPSSGSLEYLPELFALYVELVKKNLGKFFRYPLLFNHFYRLFKDQLILLAKQKSKRTAPADQKIKILDIGGSTGEEPISIVLTAAFCLENQRKNLTKILGRDPGQISDWLEIVGTEKQARFSEDIESFLTAGQYPNALIDEIPAEYLAFAKRQNFIIEGKDSFSFCPEIMKSISVVFLNFFDPKALNNPIFNSGHYDFVFYIKVLEYLMTDAKNAAESMAGQAALNFFDSGSLLNRGGVLLTDGNNVRLAWSSLMEHTSRQEMLYAALRRMPSGQALEPMLGPKRTASNDPAAMLEHGEIQLPLSVPPLSSRSFTSTGMRYPMDEVAAFKFTGRIFSPADEVRDKIAELERTMKAANKVLGRGHIPPQVRTKIQTEVGQLEGQIRNARQELRELEQALKGGAK